MRRDEHGALGDCRRYIPSRHITGIPNAESPQIHRFMRPKVLRSTELGYLCRLKIQTVMTKAEIVREVSKSTGIEATVVQAAVEGFMEAVKGSLAKGENVYLRGFGTFESKVRKQKTARNIAKNTTVIIPEHKVPAFKPCPEFKNMVK